MTRLPFFQSIAALLWACHTCSIVSAQPASAPAATKQQVELMHAVSRTAGKIQRNIEAIEREIEALEDRKRRKLWIAEIFNEIQKNPAEYDNGKALYRIGNLFEDDAEEVDIEADPFEAAQWYIKAATWHNHLESQKILGRMYFEGVKGKNSFVSQNIAEAAKWFEKAAKQGDPESQFNFAVVLALGQGVRKDEAQAEQWLQKAEMSGVKDIRENFEMIKKSFAERRAAGKSWPK